MRTERFLYRELGLVIGVLVIVYEQIRLSLMQGSLKKEMWVPVLNDNGKVIGCIARFGQPLFTEEILSSDRAYRRCL